MTEADSPLWTRPASDDEPFRELVAPDNLDEVVADAMARSEADLRVRLRPYQTKVTMASLLRLLD